MVDRVYKRQIPELRKTLEKLKEEFSQIDSKTDWVNLRIEPVLKHAVFLEKILNSNEHSKQVSRLTKGVTLFHSDLMYLRTNVAGLKKILESERT